MFDAVLYNLVIPLLKRWLKPSVFSAGDTASLEHYDEPARLSERSPSPGLLSWWQTTKPLLLSPHIQMVTEALDPSHVEDHLHMEVISLRYVVKPYGKFTKAPLLPFPTEG